METYDAFTDRASELSHLKAVMETLQWDQETMMPPDGIQFRAQQLAFLASLHHQKLVADDFGRLIEELEDEDLGLWGNASVRVARREYDRASRLPSRLVRERAKLTALAHAKWVRAREAADFPLFAPWLDKIFDLKREEASLLNIASTPYENLMDDYEPNMDEDTLDGLFTELREELTGLLKQIMDSPVRGEVRPVKGNFALERQKELGRQVLTAMGFNWDAGRLDVSVHPFCTGLTPHDVRMTTRYSPEDFTSSLFGIIHEGGHGLYEQGLDSTHYGLPACSAISLGIHESQSRLWENQVGRSNSFWVYWLPKANHLFGGSLDYSVEDFERAVNRVDRSLIRVEADEVTYGLHIILRYQIEKQFLTEEIPVQDLPEIWNDGMQEFVGIRPGNDAEGVLQDTHWSHGLIGYFPTYLLGNLYGAQMLQQARADLPDLENQVANGQMLELREWLLEKVHRVGRTRTAEELIKEITGRPLETAPYLDYLRDKYGRLYKLDN